METEAVLLQLSQPATDGTRSEASAWASAALRRLRGVHHAEARRRHGRRAVAHHTSTTLHSLGHLDRPGAEVCVDAAGRAACERRREGSRPRSGGGGGGARAERRRRRRWHESAGGAPGEATGADGGRGGAATGWERDAPAGMAVLNACVGSLQTCSVERAQPDAATSSVSLTLLIYLNTHVLVSV